MGKLTQRRAVGDDPGNVNIKAWRWSKIIELSWNHHQSNPSLSYSTSKQINHPTIQQKASLIKPRKKKNTHPGIRNLVTYFSMAVDRFRFVQLSRSKAFPAGLVMPATGGLESHPVNTIHRYTVFPVNSWLLTMEISICKSSFKWNFWDRRPRS